MNPYDIDLTESNLRAPIVSLNVLYNGMPATSGCENCEAENGDNAYWCCKTQTPSMYYIEFLHVFKHLGDTWGDKEKKEVVLRAVRNYLTNSLSKGCIFYDGECTVYADRPFACFMQGTMVLTEYGPMPIEKIYAGIKVMTHKGRYKKVIATQSQLSLEGTMKVSCKGDLGVYCTESHQFLSVLSKDKRKFFSGKEEWTAAKDLQVKQCKQLGHYVSFPKVRFGDGSSQIHISDYIECVEEDGQLFPFVRQSPSGKSITPCPDVITVDEDFLWMIGLYLAEGSFSGSCVRFTLHENEADSFGKRLMNYFKRIGLSASGYTRSYSKVYTVVVSSSVFGRFVSKICGRHADGKQLFPWLFKSLSSEQLYSIYKGWNDGDGCKSPGQGILYRTTSVSRDLIYQMYFVLKANGLHPFIYEEKRKTRSWNSYNLVVYEADVKMQPGQGNCYKEEDQYSFYPVSKCETVNFPEPVTVFDLQVEDDESFVTSSGIVHNCRMYGVIPKENWDKRWESLKERQGENFEAKPQCQLVSSEEEITAAMEDKWFLHTRKAEQRIGIPDEVIDLHDGGGGSYRTFHDHLLLEIFGDRIMGVLTEARLTNSTAEEIELLVQELRKQLDGQSKPIFSPVP